MSPSSATTPKCIAVLGAGQMGSGIATLLADAGHTVALWDLYPAVSARVSSSYTPPASSSGSGSGSAGSVTAHTDVTSAVAGAEVIFEAIAEDLGEKHKLYATVSSANLSAIIASNTSSLPASRLAAGVAHPERFAIAHFFNPPRIVPLVEIVPTPSTNPAVLDTLSSLLAAAGKVPVRLQKEVPGFVANRLQAALLREAFSLVADGVATFEDIDAVVRGALGARWAAAGPMMVTDLGGLDIWRAVTTQLFPVLSNAAAPPAAITERVERGELGAKTGTGLYVHDPQRDEETKARIAAHFDMDFGGK